LSSSVNWTRDEVEKDYIAKMKAVTIPTNISFDGKQRVLDISEVRNLLENAGKIVQGECDCRKRVGGCNSPLNGCIHLDDRADRSIERESGREITVEEALSALEESYNAGLVHMAYVFSGKEKPTYICSCCSCCCHSLGAALKFGYSEHVIYSKLVAEQNEDNCADCGSCVDRCHFNARSLSGEKLNFESENCGGCGLCLKACANDAITMVERK
jgi:Pyruvate/2-oxoacid:ferredoxin oxidoreductase delta subunit